MKMSGKGLQSFLGQSQEQLVALWPGEITLNGEIYDVACIGERSEGTLEEGGYEDNVDLVISLSKKFHPQKPEDGTLLEYKGREYRIHRVPKLLEPTWTIYCQDPDAR